MGADSHYLRKELYELIQTDSSIFEFLQSGSLDGIWYWDLKDPENEWMSHRFWTVLGYDPKKRKHLASEWQDLINPQDLQVALENFTKHCEDPQHPYDQIVRYKHRDGSTVWVRCRGIAIRDETGKPIRMLGAHTNLTQQKRNEEMLRDSERNYKLLAENSADVIYKLNIETERYIYVSPSIENMLGYTVEEALSLNPKDAMTADSYRKQRDILSDTIASNSISSEIIELEIVHKNGHILPIEVHANFITDEQGNPAEILGVIRDISKRKEAEKRTKKLNKLNQDLLLSDALQDKLKRITDGVVEIFNADFARIWIVKPGDSCDSGCTHAKIVEGPHICKYRDQCLHLLSSSGRYTHTDRGHERVPYGCYKIGRIASEEYAKFLTNNVVDDPRIHDHKWARSIGLKSFAGYRLISEHGRCIGVLALFSKNDITNEIDALLEGLASTTSQVVLSAIQEEKLRDREQLFRDLTESTSDWVWEIDNACIYTYSSPKIEDILGYSPEEVIGKTPFDFMPPKESEHISEVFNAILKKREPFDSIMNVNIHKYGHEVIMETSGVPHFDSHGNLVGYRGIDRDITKRKQAEDALQEAANKQEQLIGELKEALSKVSVLSGLLPICASCKKIRDDTGYWNQIEEYIRDHSDAKFSHGLCPGCAKNLYPDLYDD